jgi:acyl carrier protein
MDGCRLAAVWLRRKPRPTMELRPETEISADLSIDSVSVMDFVMEVEDHFEIDIPLNVLSETRTMNDLVNVVEGRLKQKAHS